MSRKLPLLLVFVSICTALLLQTNAAVSRVHAAGPYVVNSTGNGLDVANDGLCQTATPGECTLVAATQQIIADGGGTINFNITGPGCDVVTLVCTIQTAYQFVLNVPVVIDGYTQPGSSQNTLANGDNAKLKVQIDGSLTGASSNGFELQANNSSIRGLVINGFGQSSIRTYGANAIITGNFLGTDPTGTATVGASGRLITVGNTATNTRIGGTTPAERNLVSGAKAIPPTIFEGISVQGAAGTLIQGNFIGTDATGSVALPNDQGIVVSTSATGTVIGGTTAGARNVISGNGSAGVFFFTGSTTIQGNFIGVNAAGVAPLPNKIGVQIQNADGVVTGGTIAGAGNVIAYNSSYGVAILGAAAIQDSILGNSIHHNTTAGIFLSGSNNNIAAPVITTASAAGASGSACANCRVEVFSDSDGQGETFVGFANATAGGAWSFTNPIGGPNATATATDSAGNTSRFSASVPLVTAPIVVTTSPATSITSTNATLGGNVTSDGGSALTGRGIVFALNSANPNPTVGGAGVTTITDAAATTGAFSENAAGLAPSTTYAFRAYASNGSFTAYGSAVTFTTSAPSTAPAFTSAASTSFAQGSAGSFNVTASGSPAPTFSVTSGELPAGVTLSASGQLSGTPTVSGVFNFVITAANGVSPNATQNFTLTVQAAPQAPAFTSPNATSFTIGTPGSFTVMASGVPAATLSMTGALPSGVSFTAATGLLAGTPAAGTVGTYPLVFTASNGVLPNAVQNFTLTVNPACQPNAKGCQPFVPTTVAPPKLTAAFAYAQTKAMLSFPVGATTALTFTLRNDNASPLTGVGFTDTLPAGLVVSTPNGLSGSCGAGVISAVAGGSAISLTGATLVPNTVCSFSVNVTSTSTGLKTTTTSAVTSNEGGSGGAATASLTVS